MRLLTALLAALAIAVPAYAEQTFQANDIKISHYKSVELVKAKSQIIATGDELRLEKVSKEAGKALSIDSHGMVITVYSTPGAKGAVPGLDSIKDAEFTGPVKIVSVSPKTTATADKMTFDGADGIAHRIGHVVIDFKSAELTGPVKIVSVSPKTTVDPKTKASAAVTTTTTATADQMTFSGTDGIAHLIGHVVVTRDDPSMFASPAVMTGEQASVNLKGTGDFDFRSAEFTGPVKIVSVSPKTKVDPRTKAVATVTTTTTATADKMTFDGTDGIAHLMGHVVITQDDPSMFASPAVMTGEQASVNLRGTGDFDVKIESPSGTSKIEVIPNEAPKKK